MKSLIKSIFNVVAAMVLLFAAIAVFVAKSTSSLMVNQAEKTVRSIVKATTGQIDRLMTEVEAAVANQKWIIAEHLEEPDYMYRVTQELVKNNEYIVGSTVAFRPNFYKTKGRLYSPYSCWTADGKLESFTLPYEYLEYDWYKVASERGEPHWSEPYYDEGGGGIDMSTFSMPIYEGGTNFCAIFTADLSLEQLKEHVAAICPFPNSYAVMRSASGKLLVAPPKGQAIGDGSGKTITIRDQADNGWTVEVVCPTEEIVRGAQQLLVRIIIFSAVGLMIIFVIAWVYSTRLQRSIALRARMAGELNTANNIQMGLLPRDFTEEVFAKLRPAREVGGDLYDFVKKGNRLYFMVGDASGKGVPAALFAFMAGTVFRMACNMELRAGEIAERINQVLSHNNEMSMFVTAFVGIVDLETGDLEFSCAGHNPPIIISPTGEARFLAMKHGLVLGAMEDKEFETQHEKVARGARILVYTDGVTEAEKANHAQFGETQLLKYAESGSQLGVKEIVEGLLRKVDEFVAGGEQFDDITIMAIKIKE